MKWRRYQHLLPSRPVVENWFSVPRSLALVTGWQGLAVLDFDDIPTYARWYADNAPASFTHTVRTRRGFHAYYTVQERAELPVFDKVDVQDSTSRLVVAPPSEGYAPVNGDHILEIGSLAEVVEGLREIQGGNGSRNVAQTLNTEQTSRNPCEGVSLIERIKSSVSIVSVLSWYTEPRRSSSGDNRWWIARCPRHDDHRPSFWADNALGLCGCLKPQCRVTQPRGRPMDVFNLVAWVERLENWEAIERVREVAG